MNWKRECFSALSAENMFDDMKHRNRFKELLYCYGDYPFFTRGLCKCMYMSAMDEEHFCMILEILSRMSISKEETLDEMRSNGELLAEEQHDAEYYVYLLSNAFLDDEPFVLADDVELPSSVSHVIRRALQASEIIDRI